MALLRRRTNDTTDTTVGERRGEYQGGHRADGPTDAPTDTRTDRLEPADRSGELRRHDDTAAREKFGGANWGACFFGWLVAIGISILLIGIAGAITAAVGSNAEITQSEAERQAGNIGVAAAITLLVVLVIGYYAGGYVAGRMSRFDGGRQGFGVWAIGLVITIVAIGLGAIFGTQYNVLDRVNLPNLPISTEEFGGGAAITALAVLLLTVLAAVLGGKAGHHYHDRVDRAAWR